MSFPLARNAAASFSLVDASVTGRVMVVEDERVLRRTYARELAEAGFSVDASADGRAALSRLENGEFDLLLTDLNVPGEIDGDSLARVALEQGWVNAVIMVSGNPDRSFFSQSRVRPESVRAVLKPVSSDTLLEHVREMMAKIA